MTTNCTYWQSRLSSLSFMQEDHFTSECNGWGCAQQFFWGGNFHHLVMKRIPVQLIYQGFLCKKMHRKTSDFEKKTPELLTFRHWVPAGCKNIARFLNFSTFLVVTQICLIPLVDDCQCGYITELGEKIPGCAASFCYHVSWSLRELPLEIWNSAAERNFH